MKLRKVNSPTLLYIYSNFNKYIYMQKLEHSFIPPIDPLCLGVPGTKFVLEYFHPDHPRPNNTHCVFVNRYLPDEGM